MQPETQPHKPRRNHILNHILSSCLAVVMACGLLPATALADPPPWAPAYGYRAKNKHHAPAVHPATGYIVDGSCNRDALGAVLGGVVGGVVGAQVGKGEGREVATVVGALIGVMVGSSIGRSMDEADRYCTGQALEYAEDRHPVAWRNPDTGQSYVVTPTRTWQDDGSYCRAYTTKATAGGKTRLDNGTACREGDGTWRIVD